MTNPDPNPEPDTSPEARAGRRELFAFLSRIHHFAAVFAFFAAAALAVIAVVVAVTFAAVGDAWNAEPAPTLMRAAGAALAVGFVTLLGGWLYGVVADDTDQ